MFLPVAAIGTAAVLAGWEKEKKRQEQQSKRKRSRLKARAANVKKYKGQRAYLTERSLESLLAAFYLIKDGDFPGDKITIYGKGRLDKIQGDCGKEKFELPEFLEREGKDSFWNMFSMISSFEEKEKSVTRQIQESFQDRIFAISGKSGGNYGAALSGRDWGKLFRLLVTGKTGLGEQTIEDWFGGNSHFFVTHFWYLCQVLYRFQKWSSLSVFQQCLKNKMIQEKGIFGEEYLHNIPGDFYSSFIRPLERYLQSQGVIFENQSQVTDIDFLPGEKIQAKVLHILKNEKEEFVVLQDEDLCFITSGQTVEWEGAGDWCRKISTTQNRDNFRELWMKICSKKKGLGDPVVFFQREEKTTLLGFTFSCQKDLLLEAVRGEIGTSLKNGDMITLKESGWFISFRKVRCSRSGSGKEDQITIWGYALYPGEKGDFVKKSMADCTGREVFRELLYHLHISAMERELENGVTEARLCKIPYANAVYMTLKSGNTPRIIPRGAVNLAVLTPYVLTEKGGVYTKAQAVENAQAAVCDLLGIPGEKLQSGYAKKIKGIIKSLITIGNLGF